MEETDQCRIINQYYRLVCKKPVDSITFEDILAECPAGSRSFYDGFYDSYDLTYWCFFEQMKNVRLELEEPLISDDVLLPLLKMIQDYQEFSAIILHSLDRAMFHSYMKNAISTCVIRNGNSMSSQEGRQEQAEELLEQIAWVDFVEILADWIEDRCSEPPTEIALSIYNQLRRY